MEDLLLTKKKEIIRMCLDKGILVNKELLEKINNIKNITLFYLKLMERTESQQEFNIDDLNKLINSFYASSMLLNPEEKNEEDTNEKIKHLDEGDRERDRERDNRTEQNKESIQPTVNIKFSYKEEPKKRELKDFVSYFHSRYISIRSILLNRKELASPVSIARVLSKGQKEEVALIGLIYEKQVTKNENIILTLEDPTGFIKVLINKNKPEIYQIAKDCVLDEVIGVVGMSADRIIFANNLLLPDIPLFKELKKSPDETYALFMGDFHFGSKAFLQQEFNKFLTWIKGEHGTESQRSIAQKVKYIVLIGDLVEGVGIYPSQESDLEIKDIYQQYQKFAEFLEQVPPHIKMIICPGNHDAMRLSEPQPPLYRDFAEAVWKLPNAIMVSNPAIVNIHSGPDFPGFDILLYHGFSFIYYSDKVESIREKGGQKRADLIMQFLLQRRHLAPTHTSTLYLPDSEKDNLVIDTIPDFFVSGHIHRTSAANYRNITTINSSGWLKMTDYQEKVGLISQPARAVLVNLQTRKTKILKFGDD